MLNPKQQHAAEQVDGIFALIPKRRMTCAGINVGEVVLILVRKHNDGRLNDIEMELAGVRGIVQQMEGYYKKIWNMNLI